MEVSNKSDFIAQLIATGLNRDGGALSITPEIQQSAIASVFDSTYFKDELRTSGAGGEVHFENITNNPLSGALGNVYYIAPGHSNSSDLWTASEAKGASWRPFTSLVGAVTAAGADGGVFLIVEDLTVDTPVALQKASTIILAPGVNLSFSTSSNPSISLGGSGQVLKVFGTTQNTVNNFQFNRSGGFPTRLELYNLRFVGSRSIANTLTVHVRDCEIECSSLDNTFRSLAFQSTFVNTTITKNAGSAIFNNYPELRFGEIQGCTFINNSPNQRVFGVRTSFSKLVNTTIASDGTTQVFEISEICNSHLESRTGSPLFVSGTNSTSTEIILQSVRLTSAQSYQIAAPGISDPLKKLIHVSCIGNTDDVMNPASAAPTILGQAAYINHINGQKFF